MKRLNQKGQVLILFVLLIPFLLILSIFVIDTGKIFLVKRELDMKREDVSEYIKKTKEIKEEEIKKICEIENIQIKIKEEEIEIQVSKKIDSIFDTIYPDKIKEVKETWRIEKRS